LTTMLVYHASDETKRIEDIKFPGLRTDCDFGAGFYVAHNKNTAEEWVCTRHNPVINVYRLECVDNDILYIRDRSWVQVVTFYRRGIGKVSIRSNVACGVIANDRLDDSLSLFLNGDIGDLRLIRCLDYCNFGDQFVFRESSNGLLFEDSYVLKGLDLQRANERFYERRRNMRGALQSIRRSSIDGEKFIEDYEEMVFIG